MTLVRELPRDPENTASPIVTPLRRPHISEIVREIISDVPREVFETLPRDGAREHDHYLYGSAKNSQ